MLKVTDVEYMGNYTLLCRFNNGLQRYVDMEPLLKLPVVITTTGILLLMTNVR